MIYAGLRLLNIKYYFITAKDFKIPLWSLLFVIPFLYWALYHVANTADKNLGDSVIANGGFESNTNGWTAYKSATGIVAGGQSGNALQVTTSGRCHRLCLYGRSY